MNWTFLSEDVKPAAPGWHAVLICRDENEGVFPGAAYWTELQGWSRKSVVGFGDRCEDEASARALAYANDPEDMPLGPDDAPQPTMPDGSPLNPSEYGTIVIDAREEP